MEKVGSSCHTEAFQRAERDGQSEKNNECMIGLKGSSDYHLKATGR